MASFTVSADLLALPFSASNLLDPKVGRLMEFICNRMNDECDGGDTPKKALMASKPKLGGRNIFGESNIMFLLVKDNRLLSSALLIGSNQIAFRWTPPEQRGKGYAGTILKKIEEAWRVTTKAPLWVCSSPHMFKSNERNGWITDAGLPGPDNKTNKDGSTDWFPPWCADRYAKRWLKCCANRKDLSAQLMEFIMNNKDPNEEDNGEDYERFQKQWKPFETRKAAQKVRV
jgi:hypothetical protein